MSIIIEKAKEASRPEQFYAELTECHLVTKRDKRHTVDERRFEVNLFEDLMILAQELGQYIHEPSPGVAFITNCPVVRKIFAAPYRDRIIHHLFFYKWSHIGKTPFV